MSNVTLKHILQLETEHHWLHPLYAGCTLSTCVECASVGYTRCTSLYLCASLLQNLSVPQELYSPLSGIHTFQWNDLDGPVFDDVGQAGFMSIANSFLFARFLSSTVFIFLFFMFIGWYCVAGELRLIGYVNHSLPALHCRPLLIIIIIVIIEFKYTIFQVFYF